MMRALMLLIPLAGCATTRDAGRCDAARAQVFVGAIGTAELGRVATARSGAKFLRWLPPGAMATMDYRTDRLNITLDGRNTVTGIACG